MTTQIHRVSLGYVNCYLVQSDGNFVLVDTGIRSRRNALCKALAAAGCKPGDLRLIVLTHGDIDHTDNCVYLRETFGAPVAMHRGDSRMVEHAEIMGERRVNSPFMRLMHVAMRRFGIADRMAAGFEKFTPDIYLEDGQTLAEFGLVATVVHIPGHTQGSIGIRLGTGEFLCGDTLQNGNASMIVENDDQLAASMKRLSTLDLTMVYPGHGKPFPWVEPSGGRRANRAG